MTGRSNEEIYNERNEIMDLAKDKFGEVQEIESFNPDPQMQKYPIWCLGDSIKELSKADFVVFANNWEKSKGCQVEYTCVKLYNIPYTFASTLKN